MRILAGVFGAFFLVVASLRFLQQSEEFNFDRERLKLEKLFSLKGSQEAYDYFKTLDKSYGPNLAHNLGHWVGAELYKREGVEGLSLCDGSSGYSCYHGFFTKAMAQDDGEFLEEAESVCSKIYEQTDNGGCFHGVGHGMLSLGDYSFESLGQTLQVCDRFKSSSFAPSFCRGGVFMEYNLRSMQEFSSGEIVPRELDPANPLDPCDLLNEKYQPDCFYELTGWWVYVLDKDFEKMAALCSKLTKASLESCFRGIGRNLAIAHNYNLEKVGLNCGKASDKDKEWCIMEAMITSLGDGVTEAVKLCNFLENPQTCLSRVQHFRQ